MKEKYSRLEYEIITFNSLDIITSSCNGIGQDETELPCYTDCITDTNCNTNS